MANTVPVTFVRFKGNIDVSIEVLGPSWAHAEQVSLYINGVKVKEEKITNRMARGQKWKGVWTIPVPKHDVFVVAIAEGSGAGMPYLAHRGTLSTGVVGMDAQADGIYWRSLD